MAMAFVQVSNVLPSKVVEDPAEVPIKATVEAKDSTAAHVVLEPVESAVSQELTGPATPAPFVKAVSKADEPVEPLHPEKVRLGKNAAVSKREPVHLYFCSGQHVAHILEMHVNNIRTDISHMLCRHPPHRLRQRRQPQKPSRMRVH